LAVLKRNVDHFVLALELSRSLSLSLVHVIQITLKTGYFTQNGLFSGFR